MTRGEFLKSAGAAAVVAAAGGSVAAGVPNRHAELQKLIDAVKAADYEAYMDLPRDVARFSHPAFDRLEQAFDKVKREVAETAVTGKPAVWLVYNMGIVVKTPQTCFSVDLNHRRAVEMAPFLDFALITHNHDDHYRQDFYRAMNGAHKTVISNFMDNYGARRPDGLAGYTRAEKTFRIKDVEIRTSLTDHNPYLIDFTTAFEIKAGDFVIYHSGDCSNPQKLHPQCENPDLWFVHPRCAMRIVDGAKRVNPKLVVVSHLNELGHDRWRWSWANGFEDKASVEAAGYSAVVPLWGDRIA